MASRIRRKPLYTYKSPTAEDHSVIVLPFPRPRDSLVSTKSTSGPSSSIIASTSRMKDRQHTNQRRYPMTPSLPLFHPFGQLAMSLPPLEPTAYGLPSLPMSDDTASRSAAFIRRPAEKARETEEIVPQSSTVSAIVAVAAREVRERASPRKRRAGGAKRKRRDADDGDATYPAKRTRIPRGNQVADEDAMETVISAEVVTSIPEVFSDLNETLTRRSTRGKTGLKRRNSSSSETTSISPSANGLDRTEAVAPSMTESKGKMDVTDQLPIENDDKVEKEEGELSDDHIS